MRRTLVRSTLAALALAGALTGCSAGPLEQLPQSMGGLPSDAPQPPKTTYEYPAVHDMPPPRTSEPLSEDQQWKLEHDLKALRDRQEKRTGTQAQADQGDKKPAKTAKTNDKKKPAAKPGESTGAKANP
jgi:predicted small lipoprotein YifL